MNRLAACVAVALVAACNADRASPLAEPDAVIDAAVIDATGPDFGPPPDPEAGPALSELIEGFNEAGAAVAIHARNPADGETVAYDATAPVFAAELARLLPVVVYSARVASGALDPETSVTIAQEHLRGKGLREDDVGVALTLDRLARRTLIDNDRTAEAALVETLGGAAEVESVVSAWAIVGLGGYLGPCERDRAYGLALDSRFGEVPCGALGAYLHRGDPGGLSPAPFVEVPVFDAAAQVDAAATLGRVPRGAVTARAWSQLLSRMVHRTLTGGVSDERVLAWLDDGLGDGGGGDGVPGSAWVGALGSKGYGGAHWLGRVRRGQETFVAAVLTHGHVQDATRFFGDVMEAAWLAVMGSREAWPPLPIAHRHGFHSAWTLPGEAADLCDGAPPRFDDQLGCRRDAASGVFSAHGRTAVSVFLQTPPAVEIAWFWSDPDGRRRRFQKRLPAGPWWVWTRGHRPLTLGAWRAVVYVNGDPQSVTPFTVR